MKGKILFTSLCAWGLAFTLIITYLAAYYLSNLRLRNNMCIILGISHGRFVSYFEYVFQIILVIIDTAMLCVICICALVILIKTYQSQKNIQSADSKGLSRMHRLFKKLMLLLFCNMLCWIPILTIACILLTEGNVHEDVFAWMTIIIIPISATTDPFLYNIHLFRREKNK